MTPTVAPTPTEPTAGPDAATSPLPVYYVAATGAGPRLFREFHDSPGAADPAGATRTALDDALSGNALDPDYGSSWPGGTTATSATFDDGGAGLITVDLSGSGDLGGRPGGLDGAGARAAVQQLVFTAQAGFGSRAPVRFLLDGASTPTLLGVPTAEPVAAGDLMTEQGTVWVISPQDGDTVDGSFTVEGRGAFFEATVSWQLLQDGTTVQEGFSTATECCTLAPYSFTVSDVAPGDYVLRVYDADVSGGEGGPEAQDTKRITVR